jgi:hypothetical protein
MSWWDFLTLLFGPSRRSAQLGGPPRGGMNHRVGVLLAVIVILAVLVACQSPIRPMP